jgi:hypothetical protein
MFLAMRRDVLPLVTLFLLLLGTPKALGLSVEADVSEATRTRLLELVAGLQAIGAEPAGEARFYGENLWELINGAAEAFHGYDMEALLHQDFMLGETEITVELYDMGKPLNAFGIYSAERSPNRNFIEVGTQGYVDDYTLNFLQDRYYVKLSVFGDNGQPAGKRIAGRISEAIGEPGDFPPIFSHFPAEGRVPDSEKLIIQSPLGYGFLSPVFEASYKAGDEVSLILVSEAGTQEEALARLRQLRQAFERSGEVEQVEQFGGEAFKASSPYQDPLVCVPVQRFLVLMVKPPAGWQERMHQTIRNLSAFDPPQ